MAFQPSLTRIASKNLERNRFGTPARTFAAAIPMHALRGGRDFSGTCELGILDSANAANHGLSVAAMRRANIQGGAAR